MAPSAVFVLFVVGMTMVLLMADAAGEQKAATSDACMSQTTCGQCLRTPLCTWCAHVNFTKEQPRCFVSTPSSDALCPENQVVKLDTHFEVTRDEALTKRNKRKRSAGQAAAAEEKKVQIQPQNVSLKLPVGQEFELNFEYSRAEDFPIDLYYLMDLSNSMGDDKVKLSKMGDSLTATMKSLTTEFQLGFGSFVDKVTRPFTSTLPEQLKKPCGDCTSPYGFKNHLALHKNTTLFFDEVKATNISGNIDAPEGGFDAIMQAIVCGSKIGWRPNTRHLLLFSTDDPYHSAGDGKMAGIIAANDGRCHLDDNGLYDYSLEQDYPSISQINLMAKKHAVNIIFAVTEDELHVYEKVSRMVEGSSCAVLNHDSSNVAQLVKDEYNKISSSIEIKDNANQYVQITYHSSCANAGSPIQTTHCSNLTIGQVVKFTAKIVVTACPADPKDWSQTIRIRPVGQDEWLDIDLHMLCDCPCEHEKSADNSIECSGHGNVKCGICMCENKYMGRNCECNRREITTGTDTTAKLSCRRNNSTTAIDCSGRGTCLCGQCECQPRDNPAEVVRGRFCECDNFSCDRSGGQLCSGHGTCECGTCVCQPGWTGAACACRDDPDACIQPGSPEVCSGHGDCVCGECKCHTTAEGRFSSRYCERCPTCRHGQCLELRDCVQCLMYGRGRLAAVEGACAANCTALIGGGKPEAVEGAPPVEEAPHENLCTFDDDQGCRYSFVFVDESQASATGSGGGPFKVRAQAVLACPTPRSLLTIVGIPIAAILAIGVLSMLLWKLLTTIHDRREYESFEKSIQSAMWGEGGNPIYFSATSKYENPTYQQNGTDDKDDREV